MGRSTIATALLSTLALSSQVSAALPPIVVKGSKFFFENGTQFFVKGIAYQKDTSAMGGESATGEYNDPLADETACKRDIPIMAAAGTNAIRTYAIDPTKNHDACMKMLDEHGIYVISDLSEPKTSINRDSPAWNTDLYKRYTAVIDNLQKYPNVIGFFAGNEVSNNATNTGASAFVKAAVRDMKKYIKTKGYRWMGVGYAANDDEKIREYISVYFNCNNADESIDFWGYNIYSWCGDSSYTKSGYDKQVEFFKDYSVPVFFAEYGCNVPSGAEGRKWDDTAALYGDKMTPVFSGGIVYMYFQEANDYGLVKVDSSGKASTMKNYDTLKQKIHAAEPSGVSMSSYNPSLSQKSCPSVNSNWAASQNLPPTPDTNVCQCMFNSLSCSVSNSANSSSYGEVFGFICGQNGGAMCKGIKADPKAGVYGAYSMCSPKEQLGYVLNEYYKSQKNDATSCDFKGIASTVKASPASSCSSVLASASSANAAAGSGKSSNSDGKKNDAARTGIATVAGGLYLLAAMGAGAAMLLL